MRDPNRAGWRGGREIDHFPAEMLTIPLGYPVDHWLEQENSHQTGRFALVTEHFPSPAIQPSSASELGGLTRPSILFGPGWLKSWSMILIA